MEGAEFHGNGNGKEVIETCPAMVCESQTDAQYPCLTGTSMNPRIRRRSIGPGAPPPICHPQPTPERTPPPPRRQPAPPGDNDEASDSQIEGMPLGYVYIHTPLPKAQSFNLDVYAKDSKYNTDLLPQVLTEEGMSTY
jgi:hypothetical protein